jgi:hypothetical protein
MHTPQKPSRSKHHHDGPSRSAVTSEASEQILSLAYVLQHKSSSTMVRFILPVALCLWYASSLTTAWTAQSIHNQAVFPRSLRLHATNAEDTRSALPRILLYNSKSRSKEVLQPLQSNKISMYTCGPTVYDFAHVGNFRAFLTYDVIKRVLLYFGYDVTHICNLTDVDDKIINRANEQGIKNIQDLTLKYEKLFIKVRNSFSGFL